MPNGVHKQCDCTHEFYEMSKFHSFRQKKTLFCAHSLPVHVTCHFWPCVSVRAFNAMYARYSVLTLALCSKYTNAHTSTRHFDIYHDFWSSHAFSCKQLHSKLYNAEKDRIERTPFTQSTDVLNLKTNQFNLEQNFDRNHFICFFVR